MLKSQTRVQLTWGKKQRTSALFGFWDGLASRGGHKGRDIFDHGSANYSVGGIRFSQQHLGPPRGPGGGDQVVKMESRGTDYSLFYVHGAYRVGKINIYICIECIRMQS